MKREIERYEIRLAGAGGQGMILAGVILSEAVAIFDGRNAIQTQSYGPEARGGASRAEVIISDSEIYYPKVIAADVLLALSQEACDRYFYILKPDGLLILDSGCVERVPSSRAVSVPITEIARTSTGRAITANMVALGIIGGLTGVVSKGSLEKAVRNRAPRGTADLNVQAVEAGWKEALRISKEDRNGA